MHFTGSSFACALEVWREAFDLWGREGCRGLLVWCDACVAPFGCGRFVLDVLCFLVVVVVVLVALVVVVGIWGREWVVWRFGVPRCCAVLYYSRRFFWGGGLELVSARPR